MALIITKKYKDRVNARMLELTMDPEFNKAVNDEMEQIKDIEAFQRYIKDAYAMGVIEDRLLKHRKSLNTS